MVSVAGEGPAIVLATANQDKAVEIRAVLGSSVRLLPRPPEVPDVVEDGATLTDNARLKASALVAATGMPALADDTGLEVAALGGAPGVRSARYAGEGATYADNVAALLAALEGVTGVGRRRARFRTVVVLQWPDGRELVAEGAVDGVIATEPTGAGGFGYDPVFVPEGSEMTFAQMDPEKKSSLSHRGRALRALAAQLGV